jgi:hypothetical protein
MDRNPDDVVRVFSGTLIEVEMYQQVLDDAGIQSKVVGDELGSAGLGTVLPGSVELWVHQNDLEKAVAAIKRDEEGKRHPHGGKHPHPTSDPKPGQAPHRKEPHVKQDPFNQ